MLVRFAAAASLLFAVAVVPALCGARSVAEGTATVVSVRVARTAPEDPDREALAASLASRDAAIGLAAASSLALRGCAVEIPSLDPAYAGRLLKAVAARRLERQHALAGWVLIALGDAARTAACELRAEGTDDERAVAAQVLRLLGAGAATSCADWKPLPRVEW